MKIVSLSIRRPVTITMLMLAVVVFGLIAFRQLAINLLPDITYPTVTVRTEYPGTAPEEIESIVSRPIEEAVGVVDNVIRVSSISRPEMSDVVVEFAWGTNIDFAVMDIRERLDQIMLPLGTEQPIILRYDPSLEPIMRLGIHGGASLLYLRYLTEERIRQEFENIDGVAAARVSGGLEEEIQVEIDSRRLAALNIPIQQVGQRLAQENVNLTGGFLKDGESEFLVRTLSRFIRVEEIEDIIIGLKERVPIRLRDIGRVRLGHKERDVITRLDGRETVEIAIYKEAASNTVMVAGRVKEKLETILQKYRDLEGAAFTIDIIEDQSHFIQESINQVLQTAIIGGVLAIGILFLFLRNLPMTLIIGLSIPISVIGTFFLMYLSRISLNIMSLGGLALGIGMLVDNSIVVLESIFRHRETSDSIREAAFKGTTEVGKAVSASTLTTVCVFFPIVFVTGIAGQLFRDQALTVTFSLITSLLVALTLIPMLASFGGNKNGDIKEADAGKKATTGKRRTLWWAVEIPARIIRLFISLLKLLKRIARWILNPAFVLFEIFYGWVERAYPPLLTWSLHNRFKLFFTVLALFFVALWSSGFLGRELIPEMSQGELLCEVELIEGTPIEQTSDRMIQLEEIARRHPDLERVYGISGSTTQAEISTVQEKENMAQLSLILKRGDLKRRETRVMEDLRREFDRIPGIRYKFRRPTLFSTSTPIEIEVREYNLSLLSSLTDELAQQLRQVPGLFDVKSNIEGGNPEILVRFDRVRVADMGTTIGQIAAVIRNKVEGEIATEFTRGDQQIDIRVRTQEDERRSLADIERLTIQNQQGQSISLLALADIEVEQGPSEIRRVDQQRVGLVTANLAGRDLGSVSEDIEQILIGMGLPPEALGGQRKEMVSSFASMRFAIMLAVFLVYLVMASQFESLLHPLVIMFTIPFGAVGVMATLHIFNQTLSVVVLIGIIMLAGIVVNNAIVLVDYINQLRRRGLERTEAITQACKVRLRPILMTSSTTVFGLLPMALGLGEGAEVRAPMAITVIGGLIVATLLTLIFLPIVYSIIDRGKIRQIELNDLKS
ncbi:efflux RND transporter permease subunit [candidate division KSB1 bacterium]